MAVPGHDERDFEFARRLGCRSCAWWQRRRRRRAPLTDPPLDDGVYRHGRLVRSEKFNGLAIDEAKQRIVEWLAEPASARRSRITASTTGASRASGTGARRSPSSIATRAVRCRCPEHDLPVLLPTSPTFRPDDSGVSPLARTKSGIGAVSAVRGPRAARRTCRTRFSTARGISCAIRARTATIVPFDPALTRRWLPVNSYIGGNEHAVLHLLYSRFITMVLHEAGHARIRGAVHAVSRARA